MLDARARKMRRFGGVIAILIMASAVMFSHPAFWKQEFIQKYQSDSSQTDSIDVVKSEALSNLENIEVKGRAPKTGYSRSQFGDGWRRNPDGCDTRNIILARDMRDVKYVDGCKVASGVLSDPYTGMEIKFQRGDKTSQLVQIDHVVALSDSWQKGAQQLDYSTRENLANDPLNLIAVDGAANQAKSDSDAASWLPENKSFRCEYVARQVAVKVKYGLWVTAAEKEAMRQVLNGCVLT